MRVGFDELRAFRGCNFPNYTVGQTVRANYKATFAKSGDTAGRRCCGTFVCERLCIESAASADMRQSLHLKKRLCDKFLQKLNAN